LPFDIESDLKEIEYLLNHDRIKEMDSIIEDSIDEIESNIEYVFDDPFDSKEYEIKESKLLIDELDPLRLSDSLLSPEYDSFLFEDFSKVDALPARNVNFLTETKTSLAIPAGVQIAQLAKGHAGGNKLG
nr:hypothetical protein [Tanacetum cinerariifolium]